MKEGPILSPFPYFIQPFDMKLRTSCGAFYFARNDVVIGGYITERQSEVRFVSDFLKTPLWVGKSRLFWGKGAKDITARNSRKIRFPLLLHSRFHTKVCLVEPEG